MPPKNKQKSKKKKTERQKTNLSARSHVNLHNWVPSEDGGLWKHWLPSEDNGFSHGVNLITKQIFHKLKVFVNLLIKWLDSPKHEFYAIIIRL